MKRSLVYDVIVAVAAVALVAVLPVHGWRLLALCGLALAIYFRPRGDAEARRERRIERESDRFARTMTDTMEIVQRGVAKMVGPDAGPPPLSLPDVKPTDRV
jgi:Flp pilus assembly protein TadB